MGRRSVGERQDLSTLLGKMLRIDVNVEDDRVPYKIPPSNPFAFSAKEQLMSLFGISEYDFNKIKTRSASGNLVIRLAQSV